jgi:acyl carrier protein
MSDRVRAQIREVVAAHARLRVDVATIEDTTDLFQAGMTSHASVGVMLALEDTFDVEFPDAMLTRRVFESVEAIASALAELGANGG